MSPMSHQETGEAMSHQHGRRRTGLHGNIQRTNPIVTGWAVPISQIHALPLGMAQLPERLPMLRPGVANTGQDQNRNVTLHAEPSLAGCAKLLWHNKRTLPQDSRAKLAGRARRGVNSICPRRAVLACLALHA